LLWEATERQRKAAALFVEARCNEFRASQLQDGTGLTGDRRHRTKKKNTVSLFAGFWRMTGLKGSEWGSTRGHPGEVEPTSPAQ